MNLQKKLFTVLFLISAACVFSEKINFFTTTPSWTFTNGIALENGTDFAPVTEQTDFSADLNYTELDMSWGIRFSPDSTDFTTQAIYWPTFFHHFNLGPGSIFHLKEVPDEYLEIDLLNGIYFKYDTLSWFNVSFGMLHLFKAARIFAIEDQVPWLTNKKNMALTLNLNFLPSDTWRLYLDFSSFSYYRYMLFFAPDFKFGTSFRFSKLFTVGSEIELQYIDMFTLSANFNSASFRTFVQVKI